MTGSEPGLALVDQVLDGRADSGATAVVDLATGEQVDYRALTRRVQALADLLRHHGVRRHGTVAMVLDKSVDAVVCMLAALRAGARYVPIDESLPPARVALVLDRCRPDVTVVHPPYRELLAGAPAGTVLTAVRAGESDTGTCWDVRAEAEHRAEGYGERSPEDHAYTIFTSGSTGGPKGVEISHRNVCALLDGVQQVVGFEEGMRYLNVAPLFFDASVVDLYSTFLVGGSVHLLPRLRMATQITQALEQWRITDTLLVPSVIRMLVGRFGDLGRRDVGAWRRIWFGGESCPVPLLRALDKQVPGLTYVHGYGPTETTHSATLFLTSDLAAQQEEFLPIGTPLPAVTVQVVDELLRPVPEGAAGELLIGGPQVMHGYRDDPGRTAQVLVERDGTRYYRSGDLVRRRADGQLVFLGRGDDAMKINGNLVHLSEVETAALALDGIDDCCAVPTEHPLTGRAITLFVRCAQEEPKVRARLHRELSATLPPYMVPAQVVVLADGEVGLTPTGKLDREHLRALAAERGER
ncbi:amino acid adenylation domain-containing protein [Kitasatospora sp. NPDC101183]|uniref:amino acid adenylation domain-containing protein n=1 Tax=Kitasatospora sp. NPDC101183 TaxID=3364100 RepID=UPI00380E2D81